MTTKTTETFEYVVKSVTTIREMEILNGESREDRFLPARMVVMVVTVGVWRRGAQKAWFLEGSWKGEWDEI